MDQFVDCLSDFCDKQSKLMNTFLVNANRYHEIFLLVNIKE